ncbi:MAG: helix-turn-helix transcriptional regulator [Ferruginibacter sp.]
MTNEQFIEFYLEGIFVAENNNLTSYRQIVFPENCIILGFQFENAISEIINGKDFTLPAFTIDGQLTRKKEYTILPGSKILLVKFKPHTASLFFPNLYELTNQTISLTNLISNKVFKKLEEQFFRNNDKQKTIVNFLKQLMPNKPADKSIVQAITIINETSGQIRVHELASKIYHSKRNFERKFKTATGLTPKQFITNARFQHSLNLLQSNNDLVDIAYLSGYYDQSHFTHEFKVITGVTPDNYHA